MIILTISVKVLPSKRNELLSAFRLFTEQTRHTKGCEACRIFQDIDDDNLINLEETWSCRPDLNTYFQSDIFSALLGAVKLLGATHEIRISDGSHTEGMEAVHAARQEKEAN